jgi:coenzyme PQQ precursor peptide PqqA
MAVRSSIFRTCAMPDVPLDSTQAWSSRQTSREDGMTWKTPKIVEVSVGMEINMYACAARK